MNGALIYFIIFAIVFVINFVASKTTHKLLKIVLPISSFLILLLFIGLRDNVGTDYNIYGNTYLTVKNMTWQDIFNLRLEPFVGIIYKTLAPIFSDFHWIYFMYGALSLLPIYIANKLYDNKYLHYSVLAYCVFFLPFSLNGMRQGVAISFAFLCFALLAKKKKLASVISMALSVCFHKTAIIILPYLLISFFDKKEDNRKRKTLLYILVTIAISILMMTVLKDFLYENEMEDYGAYLSNMSLANISLSTLFSYIPILLMSYIISKDIIKTPEKISSYSTLFYVGLIFQVVGTSAAYLNRIALYFLPGLLMICPVFLCSIKNPTTRFVVKVLFVVYLVAYFVVQYIVWGRHEIIPYATWL